MALSFGQTGTADSITAEYVTQQSDDGSLLIRMHLDAVDAIARDAVEGFKSLPRRGAEIGGLLLGHVEPGSNPVVWIERFQRMECRHRYGPQFVLDDEDHLALEQSAAAIARAGELNVVGFYRSHTRAGFQLEETDLDLVNRYFTDSSDLILLIDPQHIGNVTAQFFARRDQGDMRAAGTMFPFRGRVLGPVHMEPDDDIEPDTARTNPPERARRLVPDFAAEEPPKQPWPVIERQEPPVEEQPFEHPLGKWWPLLCLIVLVVAVVTYELLPKVDHRAPTVTSQSAPVRPLGLYVDPAGESWRVSWNPAATALSKARGVELFVRDGDDQNRIDLTPNDLQSGTYQYQPKGQDVTFRLEVTEDGGHIAAESFRFIRATAPPPLSAAAPLASTPPPAPPVRPKAIRRVAPVVAASLRPRIHGSIPVDIRVHVDEQGRVSAAVPVTKPKQGINSYLADRAVVAAKQWRFAAGSPGTETIHFVFEK